MCCFCLKQNTVSGMSTNESRVQITSYLVAEMHLISLGLKVNLTYEWL